MEGRKFRGTAITLDDGREVVVPALPVGLERDHQAEIRAAQVASKRFQETKEGDPEFLEAKAQASETMARVAIFALHLNHPEITLADLLATQSAQTIIALYAAAFWRRAGGGGAGEAASP